MIYLKQGNQLKCCGNKYRLQSVKHEMYTEWFSLIYEPVINLKTSNCIFLITEVNISIVFKVAHESCIESGKRVQLHMLQFWMNCL